MTKIQKHRDDVLKELDKVKQEQDDIEKKCSKLCDLKDKVIYIFWGIILFSSDLLKISSSKLQIIYII